MKKNQKQENKVKPSAYQETSRQEGSLLGVLGDEIDGSSWKDELEALVHILVEAERLVELICHPHLNRCEVHGVPTGKGQGTLIGLSE